MTPSLRPALLSLCLAASGVAAEQGLLGIYCDNMDLTNALTVRVDPQIDSEWKYSPPPGTALAANTWSARWVGQVVPRFSETYTFFVVRNDGARLWVNGQLLIDQWSDVANGWTKENSGTIALTAGVPVSIRLEYYQNNAGSTTRLRWTSASEPKAAIPASQLIPAVDAAAPGPIGSAIAATTVADRVVVLGWGAASDDIFVKQYEVWRDGVLVGTTPVASYRDDGLAAATAYTWQVRAVDLSGNVGPLSDPFTTTTAAPVVAGAGTGLRGVYYGDEALTDRVTTRLDPVIDVSWPAEPAPGVPADGFTVCWEGAIEPFYSEAYTLETLADNGVRVWIDGTMVIDSWGSTQTTHGWSPEPLTRTCQVALEAGRRHAIRIDSIDLADAARLRLRWSSLRQPLEVVPTSQLYPAADAAPTTLTLATPTESRTSPAWVEGTVGDASAAVAAIAGGAAVATVRGNPQAWYLDNAPAGGPAGIVLDPAAPTPVVVTATDDQGAQQLAATIAWTVTDLTDLPYGMGSLSIRAGDSLLLTAGGTGAALALDVTGDGVADLSGAPAQAFPVAFAQPGPVAVSAWIDGAAVGTLTVNVVDVTFDGPIACSITHWRPTTVALSDRVDPTAPDNAIVFTSSAPRRFQIQDLGGTTLARTLKLQALYPGDLALEARLGGATGPLIRRQSIDEFELRTTAEKTIQVVEVYPDGSMLTEAQLVMTPLVRDLDVKLHAFIAGVTFEDSTVNYAVSTNAFIPGTVSGTHTYRLIRGPAVTAGLCHTIHVWQRGVAITY